jgi:hypothetical protein
VPFGKTPARRSSLTLGKTTDAHAQNVAQLREDGPHASGGFAEKRLKKRSVRV